MTTFEVQDMSCGHCTRTITQALLAVDPGAKVQIDLPSHRVQIDSGSADPAKFSQAISQAGYTPVAVPNAAGSAKALQQAGGCCG